MTIQTDGEGNTLLSADPAGFSGADLALLKRFARVERRDQHWVITPTGRYAGLARVAGRPIYLPPLVSLETFLGMILVGHGLESALNDEALAGRAPQRLDTFPDLQQLLAALLVSQAERIASGHVAQGYLEEEGRLSVVRGRPLWHESRRHAADGRIHCRYRLKSTNVPLNRVLLSGLVAAVACISDENWARRARTQRFVWTSVADPLVLRPSDVAGVRRALTRLTEHYRPAIELLDLLIFGGALEATGMPQELVPTPLFDMAHLFELLTTRLINLAVSERGWRCAPQTTESQALLDGEGRTYRRIRPDQLLLDTTSRLLAVVDSKFKPRYGAGGPDLTSGNKISREDIYQLFFYSERLRRVHKMLQPLPAFVVVPVLSGAVPPGPTGRVVIWSDEQELAQSRLTVVPVNVAAAVRAVTSGDCQEAQHLLEGFMDRLEEVVAMSTQTGPTVSEVVGPT